MFLKPEMRYCPLCCKVTNHANNAMSALKSILISMFSSLMFVRRLLL